MVKKNLLNVFIVLAVIFYFSLGFFPISPIEGDGTGISNGVELFSRYGIGDNEFAYRYAFQPGTYILSYFFQRATNFSSIESFSILSAISSILFVLFASLLIKKTFGFSFIKVFLTVLLFQEAWVGGYYANSNGISAAIFIIGLYIIISTDKTIYQILVGALLGVAVWVRADILLISPVLFGLFLYKYPWRKSLFRTILVGLVCCLMGLFLITLSGTNIPLILSTTREHVVHEWSVSGGLLDFIGAKNQIAFFSILNIWLMIWGIAAAIAKKEYKIILVLGLGILPTYIAYLGALTTPKYLFSLIPFFSVFCIYGMDKIISSRYRKVLITLSVLLFVFQYLVGFQVYFSQKPYWKGFEPSFVSLVNFQELPGNMGINIVLGAGNYISTHDEMRLSSGIIYSPLSWSKEKSKINLQLENCTGVLSPKNQQTVHLLASDYTTRQMVLSQLISLGFNCKNDSPSHFSCTQDKQNISLYNIDNNEKSVPSIEKDYDSIPAENVILLTSVSWKQYLISNDSGWSEICPMAFVRKK